MPTGIIQYGLYHFGASIQMMSHLPMIFSVTSTDMVSNLLVVITCLAMGIFSYVENILDIKGSVMSFFVGAIIGIVGDFYWLLTLILFLAVTYGVTKLKYSAKKRMGLAQGKRGERGWRNVLANGIIPVAMVSLSPFIGYRFGAYLYITSVSIAAADTFASEVGVFSRHKPHLAIPDFRPVEKGVDGGVSPLGLASSLFGGFVPAFFGWLLLSSLTCVYLPCTSAVHQYPLTLMALVIPTLIGFIGAYIDSVLGATMQLKGIFNNDQVNVVAIGLGLLLSIPFYFLL